MIPTDCTTSRGLTGLYCEGSSPFGSDCLSIDEWCTGRKIVCRDKSSPGRTYTTDDENICRNTTFWQDKQCIDRSYTRCQGEWSGQCFSSRDNVCNGQTNTGVKTGRDGETGYRLEWGERDNSKYCKDRTDEMCPPSHCSAGELLVSNRPTLIYRIIRGQK